MVCPGNCKAQASKQSKQASSWHSIARFLRTQHQQLPLFRASQCPRSQQLRTDAQEHNGSLIRKANKSCSRSNIIMTPLLTPMVKVLFTHPPSSEGKRRRKKVFSRPFTYLYLAIYVAAGRKRWRFCCWSTCLLVCFVDHEIQFFLLQCVKWLVVFLLYYYYCSLRCFYLIVG